MKEKLNINKLIEKVETPAIRNLEWYYHSLIKIGHSETLSMNDESLISILKEGIKCNKLLKRSGKGGSNGRYYISLSKNVALHDRDNRETAFYKFLKNYISIIIDDINLIRCGKYSRLKGLLNNTKYTGRTSSYYDEYHEFWEIKPEKIIGLVYPLYIRLENNELYKKYLEELRNIILTIREINIDIPIYDYSRLEEETIHLINTELFLENYDKIIEEMEMDGFIKVYIPRKNK